MNPLVYKDVTVLYNYELRISVLLLLYVRLLSIISGRGDAIYYDRCVAFFTGRNDNGDGYYFVTMDHETIVRFPQRQV